jgi:pimeloyl-ACP methyl ester carboxylesterase
LGDARSTWTNGSAYWPDLLAGDDVFAGTSIYVHEYKTTFRGGGLSVDELAEDLKARLDADRVTQHYQLIFIAHSMGGLVARDVLLKYRDLAAKTRFIFFLATPTTGAAIANWAELVSLNPNLGT